MEKTAYELFKGIRPNISYFHQFGCTFYILNNKLYLNKFDVKAQRGIFLGYLDRSKAYRVYNTETLCVEESMLVKFDDKEPRNETPEQGESVAVIVTPLYPILKYYIYNQSSIDKTGMSHYFSKFLNRNEYYLINTNKLQRNIFQIINIIVQQ